MQRQGFLAVFMWISSGFDVLLQSFVYASSRQACTGPLLLNSSNPKPDTHPPGSTMKAHEVLLMFSGLGFRASGARVWGLEIWA